MDRVEISKGVLGSFLFALVWILHKIQSSIGAVFWFIFISPILCFFKKPADSTRPFPYIVDSSKWFHRFVWSLLKVAFAINGRLNGLVRISQAYPRIVSWNEKVPLYGFMDSTGMGSIEWLGKQNMDGTRGVDFMFLSRPKPLGHINILKKYLPEKERKILIDLAWISGAEAGYKFTVGTSPKSFKELSEESDDKHRPEYFYIPPRWFTLGLEICLSVGAILAFVSAAVGLYSDLDSSKFETLNAKVNNVSQQVLTVQSNLGSIKDQILTLNEQQKNLSKIPDKQKKSESTSDRKKE